MTINFDKSQAVFVNGESTMSEDECIDFHQWLDWLQYGYFLTD